MPSLGQKRVQMTRKELETAAHTYHRFAQQTAPSTNDQHVISYLCLDYLILRLPTKTNIKKISSEVIQDIVLVE